MSQGSTRGVPIDTDATLATDSDQLVASQKATKTYVDTSIAAYTPSVNNTNWSGAALAVANGGTGANTQADARTNLGLGTLATQSGTFSGTSSGTNTGDQTSIVGITGTKAEFDTACTDGNFAYQSDLASYATTAAVAAGYQPLDTQLTSIAALSYTGNASKVIRVNAGETDFEFVSMAGGGNVSNTGTPVNNQVAVWTDATTIEGDSALTFDTTTDTLSVGTGGVMVTGTIEVGDASDTTISRAEAGVLSVEGQRLIKARAGVGTSPTATQTDTVTHNLGRTPVIIRIYGMSQFTSNAAATPTPSSIGIWTLDDGNRCITQTYNTAAITTTQNANTSSTYAVNIQTGANSFVTGVIQNVGATTFDIAWTETGTAVAKVYMWEAQ